MQLAESGFTVCVSYVLGFWADHFVLGNQEEGSSLREANPPPALISLAVCSSLPRAEIFCMLACLLLLPLFRSCLRSHF